MISLVSGFVLQRKELLVNIRNAGFYFLGSVVQSFLALIAQPIYSMHLSASEFGILGYFDAVRSFFAPMFIFGMTSFYLMRYYNQSEEDNKKLLFNITFYLCLFNSILMLISYAGMYIYFEEMQVSIPLNPFAWFILIALLLENFKHFVFINFRIRKKAFSFFVFSVINSVLNLGLGLLFVAYFKWGAEGRMSAPIVSSVLLLPYALYILFNYSTISFNTGIFLKALKASVPIVLAAYAYFPIMNIDRFFLERLNNLPELGLYNIGITVAGYVHLTYVALGSAVEPDIFKAVAEKNTRNLIKSAAVIFLPYIAVILIYMSLSGTIISLLTAGRYPGAEPYANISLIAVFLMGVYWFLDKIFMAMEMPKMNLIVNIIGGLAAVIIIKLAVENFQFFGAAYGKVIVSVILVLTSFTLVIKYFKSYKYAS